MNETFRKFSQTISQAAGSPWMFMGSVLLIVIWALTGPLFGFSDTWQLIINTTTTIVTFLMVFLIQNTQNRDSRAIHLKLDELIRAAHGARNHLLSLESLSDEELNHIHKEFSELQERADRHIQQRRKNGPKT